MSDIRRSHEQRNRECKARNLAGAVDVVMGHDRKSIRQQTMEQIIPMIEEAFWFDGTSTKITLIAAIRTKYNLEG